ncbi:hypothetical protein EDEG_01625 [Edhazardia aedis USNM 41457]|uniref:Nuclear pore protein n=1 Tax=Edhazardia aedis (strain USNM 41457) TaxID=1003232 RepID=J8ZWS1_EDHAE|nr:hypothetical protein EDEG_01625 [Edhazardia aedis USNM 41457]|eukprot:EJW04103.1 hypothetical protein EDEG_01625 [Edhazardia aedis USNM 41457]
MPRVPFCLPPIEITNYSKFKCDLQEILLCNSDEPRNFSIIDEVCNADVLDVKIFNLRNTLKLAKVDFNLSNILSGIEQTNIQEKSDANARANDKYFCAAVFSSLLNMREDYENSFDRTNNIIVAGHKNFDYVGALTLNFSDSVLRECYNFLKGEDTSLQFLEARYQMYIDEYLKTRGVETKNMSKNHIIRKYVQRRFDQDSCNIVAFNGRFLYAELYVSIRCGNTNNSKKLLTKYSQFFRQTCYEFKDIAMSYFSKTVDIGIAKKAYRNSKDGDIFKIFLLKIFSKSDQNSQEKLITNLDDFLWFSIVSANENDHSKVSRKFEDFPDACNKLFAYLILDQHEKACEWLFRGKFNVHDAYFLMKAIADRHESNRIVEAYARLVFFMVKYCFDSIDDQIKLIYTLQKHLPPENFHDKMASFLIENNCLHLLKDEKIGRGISDSVKRILLKEKDPEKILQVYTDFNKNVICDILVEEMIDSIVYDRTKKFVKKYAALIEKFNEDEMINILCNLMLFEDERTLDNLYKTVFLDEYVDFELLEKIRPALDVLTLPAAHVLLQNDDPSACRVFVEFLSKMKFENEHTEAITIQLLMQS